MVTYCNAFSYSLRGTIALRAIVRITGVSLQWLQSYVNGKLRATPRNLEVSVKKKAS